MSRVASLLKRPRMPSSDTSSDDVAQHLRGSVTPCHYRTFAAEGKGVSIYIAWLDESGSNQSVDPGTYILSAAIGEPLHVDEMRNTMRGLLVGRRHKKLHWRAEAPGRQERIVKTIATLQVEHLIVVRSDAHSTDRPERQRRLCMERMLPELVSLGVGTAIVESRGPKDDQRDRKTLQHLRNKRLLTDPLHMSHVGGPADPMLWVPDACCGVVTQLRCGKKHFYQQIESRVTLIDI